MKIIVAVKDILGYISDEKLDFFAQETLVDWNVKKLYGKELFKRCVFGILNENRASSRVFENLYENSFFRNYAKIEEGKIVSHSSICQRIGNINVNYFEVLHKHTFSVFQNKMSEKDKIKLSLYDSTITSLSASLLHFGMQNGMKNKQGKQGKNSLNFTIGFDGLPFNVKFHQDQEMISEDLALGNILEEHVANKKDIAVFDRGMKERKTMVSFSESQKYFVTRIYKVSKYKIEKGSIETILDIENETIKLVKHSKVHLFSNQKQTKTVFRLVEGILKSNGEKILF